MIYEERGTMIHYDPEDLAIEAVLGLEYVATKRECQRRLQQDR